MQTICLNMIVKNEAHVIQRCIDSLKSFINYWIIVDTGSTDGTQELIHASLRDIPGELIERPWVDFAHNRTEALGAARGKGDYVFIIDADEVLVQEQPGVRYPLNHDVYQVEMRSGGVSYLKALLVKNTLNWRYVGVLHEYITCPEAKTEAILPGCYVVRHTDGARSRDPLTYKKDALVLERALLDEPRNERYVFYLAQSYRDANELELSIKYYQRRVEMGGWYEEVWYSLYQIAELQQRLSYEWPKVLHAYHQAYQYHSGRVEPLCRIAMYYQQRREFALAYMYLRQALTVAYPAQDRLFVEKSLYDYLLLMEFAVSAYWLGKHADAIRANNALLCRTGLPAEVFDQVLKNRQFSLDALYPKRQAAHRQRHISIYVPFHNPGTALDNCVNSLLTQDYPDFEVTCVDLGSTDGASDKIPTDDSRITLIRHDRSHPAGDALHTFLLHATPDDLIIYLDGEDWLDSIDALTRINQLYNDYDCWIAYGQFRYSTGHYGLALPYPDQAAFDTSPREWCYPMVATFHASLYQQLVEDSLVRGGLQTADGMWRTAAVDAALMNALFDAVSLAKVYFNPEVVYVYNLDGPHQEQRQRELQAYLATLYAKPTRAHISDE